MKKNDRFGKIEELAARHSAVTIANLAEYLGVSEATIRRDVSELIERGLLVRRYGSVSLANPKREQDYFEYRRTENIDAKQIIARRAAELVQDGDTIFIESGSTLYYMIRYITAERVIAATADISIAAELAKRSNIQTLMLGGYVWQGSYYVTGRIAEQILEQFYFNKYFTSPACVSNNGELMYYNIQNNRLRELVVARSNQTIVVIDSRKFGRRGFVANGTLANAHTLVTDNVPAEFQNRLPKKVVLVDTEGKNA
ncbi:MAG: DeoR/GlpR family DNA-binding transcription regulator [Acetivibrionales bacterium]|jgi:DeoR/GlpR family transcriptional regulator of sugar metabolism